MLLFKHRNVRCLLTKLPVAMGLAGGFRQWGAAEALLSPSRSKRKVEKNKRNKFHGFEKSRTTDRYLIFIQIRYF